MNNSSLMEFPQDDVEAADVAPRVMHINENASDHSKPEKAAYPAPPHLVNVLH